MCKVDDTQHAIHHAMVHGLRGQMPGNSDAASAAARSSQNTEHINSRLI